MEGNKAFYRIKLEFYRMFVEVEGLEVELEEYNGDFPFLSSLSLFTVLVGEKEGEKST